MMFLVEEQTTKNQKEEEDIEGWVLAEREEESWLAGMQFHEANMYKCKCSGYKNMQGM